MPDAFRAQYLLAPGPDAADAVEAFAEGVRAWLAHVKLPVPPPDAGAPADVVLRAGGKRVRWTAFRRGAQSVGEGGRGPVAFAEITLRRPDPAEPGVVWTTRAAAVAGDAAFGGPAGAGHVAVSVAWDAPGEGAGEADGGDAGPGPDRFALPPLLLPVLGDRAELADARGEAFPAAPRLLDTESAPGFVEHVLCNAARDRPVVVLTPRPDGTMPVPPAEVARECFGLADVYVVGRPDDTFALTDALGDKMLSVFWGAMRVYHPGFTRAADPYAHPLLFPERAAERSVRDGLRRRLAFRTVARWRSDAGAERLDARIAALRLEAELRAELYAEFSAERRAPVATAAPRRVAEAPAVYAAGPAGATASTDRADADRADANRADAARADAARERQEARLADLRAENLRLRGEIAELRRRASASAPDDSLLAVVEEAHERFGDALYFLPSAYESARASTYRRPDEARRQLEGLARVARRCQQGPVPGGVWAACRDEGLDYASGAAESTSARLRAQYAFRDGARTYECAEHLRKGVSPDPAESLRVYFTSRDVRDERFVVGHVGAHLRTMTTN